MSTPPRARRTARRPTTARGRVRVTWNVASRPLSDSAVRAAVRAALREGRRPDLAVDIVLVGDAFLRDLHRRFLHDDTPTDVIAFDLGRADGGPAGEVYASVVCARRVARARGVTPARELALYLVHGTLHLCGFDDHRPSDRRRMRTAEARVLASLGYAVDAGPHP